MERQWSLKELYESFEDQKFHNDIEIIKQLLKEMEKYPQMDVLEEHLKSFLEDENNVNAYLQKVSAFISLTMSADTKNEKAIQYYSMIENMIASFAKTNAQIKKWISLFDLESLKDDYVLEHMFYLKEIKGQNRYLLDDQSEEVLANMKTTGSSAWLQYKNQLISSLSVEFDGKDLPLTEVLNYAYDENQDVRKKAYEAEIKSYKSIEQGVASALNAIKGESIMIAKMRGYESVLDKTLIDSRMERKTLDVLLSTMKKALPMFEKYYLLKAKALGHNNGLPWYDLYAPVIENDSVYPFEKGAEFVVKQFSTFSSELGDYAKTAVDNDWIDVYPRAGKVGGAFCHNLNAIKESRFLLNYGNQFSDVTTMAHELGHGYHGHCLNNEHLLNTEYSMPIAETASIFSETIVKKAALKESDLLSQLSILDNELGDCGQVIADIYSRFLFESRVIEERKNGPLSVERVKELMVNAQKEAYGKGLDHQFLHPYMWTWKPHYYESDYAFYNFPYAFGLLLAKGLYGLYLKEGESFADKYKSFLSRTGKMTIEQVCESINIDLTDESFWKNSIDMIQEDLNLFEELLNQYLSKK